MSDPRDNSQDDKAEPGQSPNNEQTLIRGQEKAVPEGNDDATVLRSNKGETGSASEPNDDATQLRAPVAPPSDDATLVRASVEESNTDKTSAPGEPRADNSETRVRHREAEPAPGVADETIVRKDTSKGRQVTDSRDEESAQPGSDEAATILRTPKEDSATILRAPGADGATILREPENDGATILRDSPGDGSDATILREPGEDGATILRGRGDDEDGATILRGGGDDEDDATILRAGDEEADDDRTVINENYDDDSTVLGPRSDGQDTTYIASVGKQQRPQGNSEAGRLLKNRFVLEEKIGSGGMGDVYKALDLRQQEAQERDPYIAIKLLNENFARHKDAFLSLQRETSRTRGIPHPNIMGVYDFDREGDTVFMSMELLDGKPLDDFLKEHPEGVSVEDAWNIIDGISKGLMRAHDAGIVHSDFKPGNIFYTKDKVAKVFDFGIARAVSSPGELEADGEKTVFDAGSLGALTPTYASYEMLKGLEPSKSDDVYAVALVAYELFMGKHPYERVPADKAFERGLKPKPVPFLKRRHWRALRKALELKGEDRTQSIDEFYESMFSEDPPYFTYAAVTVVLAASIGFGAYQTLNVVERPQDLIDLEDAMAGARVTLNTINNPQWDSPVWHDQMSTALARLKVADQKRLENEEWVEQWDLEPDPEIEERTATILATYMDKIEQLRGDAQGYEAKRLDEYGVVQALSLLDEAKGYMNRVVESYRHPDPARVDQELKRLDVRLKIRSDQLAAIEEQERLDEERRIAAEAAEKAATEQRIFEENRLNQYNLYLAELREILKCKGTMPPEDVDRLGVLLGDLEREWPEAYQNNYPTIVSYLATCIQQRIGFVDPEVARSIQSRVITFLPDETAIASLVIENKDPCDDRKLVGRGDRNQRWCSDRLSEGGEGPELVVVPPVTVSKDDYKYAISRAEIKVGEYNFYCQSTGCPLLDAVGGNSLPATNLTIDQARGYTDWLSSQTGQVYRLPTVEEWDHAVDAAGTVEVDQNVNCTVDSRGVRLGEKLLNAISGKSNNWGLYNFVGNAREWAMTDNNELVAKGGAHTDPRNECTIAKFVPHQGEADPVTGFRIVREIEKKEADKDKTNLAASS